MNVNSALFIILFIAANEFLRGESLQIGLYFGEFAFEICCQLVILSIIYN